MCQTTNERPAERRSTTSVRARLLRAIGRGLGPRDGASGLVSAVLMVALLLAAMLWVFPPETTAARSASHTGIGAATLGPAAGESLAAGGIASRRAARDCRERM
jgi:hypothetical protein